MTFGPLIRPAARCFTTRASTRKITRGRVDRNHASGNPGSGHNRAYVDFRRYLDGAVANSDDTDLEQQTVSTPEDKRQSCFQTSKKGGFLPFMGQTTQREKASSSPPPLPSSSAPYASTSYPANEMAFAHPPLAAHEQQPVAWPSDIGLAQTSDADTAVVLAYMDPQACAQAQQDIYPDSSDGSDEEEDEVVYHSTFGTKTEANAEAVTAPTSPLQPAEDDEEEEERGIYSVEDQWEFKLEGE